MDSPTNARPNEEAFRLLVESILDYAIFLLDPEGRVSTWNRGAEQMKGYKAEEILGAPFSIFYPPEDAAAGKPARELKLALDKGSFEEEGWRLRKDGSRFWANVVITALYDSQGVLHGFSKVTREMETFSYSCAHDLRAPLRKIAGFSDALAKDSRGTLSEQSRDFLERIQNNVLQMDGIIEGLLKLSRVLQQEPRTEAVDLSGLVEAISDELQKAQPARQVRFVVAPAIAAQGDPEFLQIILRNLLENSWKFTARHQRATIEFGAEETGAERIYFVRDDGAGFDMAHSDKLFGAFKRLHAPGNFPGAGIGLATVRRVVQRHGGRIWAHAEIERGATFFFTLGRQE